MFNLSLVLQAFGNMFKSLFDFLKIQKEHQNQTEILIDKNKLKTASDIAEEAFWNMRKYFATDSQFTMWIARLAYDSLNFSEKRFFRRFYKQKAKLKKKIEKLQKEFEKNN